METRTYDIGDTIFGEGEAGGVAYLVKSGEVKITKMSKDDSQRTIATVRAGQLIGEMALIDDEPRAASAIALMKTEMLVVSKEDFDKRLETSDQVIRLLLQSLTTRLRQQAQTIIDLTL